MTTVSAQIEAQVWRVVVIDDSPDDRAEVRRLLLKGSERRYQFVEAETGAAGVRAALDPVAGPPGCVVLDYNLPDLDAVEVLAALAGPDGLTACPVVVLTGTVGHEHTRAVLRAGAQDYLGKGWMTPESLTRAVENATERWVMARELRKQKAALKTSDDRFRLAADAVNGIIYEWDILTGHVERQRGLYEVLGYHAVEVPLTAAWWREQIHPDDLEVVEQQFTELAGNSVVSEYRVRHRDGRWLHLEDRAVLLRGDDDRPVKMVGCAVDITDRKRAEERLRYSEQLHRVAFDQSPTGMVYVGADGRLIKVNPAMCVITGYPAEELVGMKVSDLTHPDDLAADAELVTPFLRGDTLTYENDKRYVRKDGGVRWVSITERMVTDAEGQPLHSVGVVRDITERKRVEGERQLLASIVENSRPTSSASRTRKATRCTATGRRWNSSASKTSSRSGVLRLSNTSSRSSDHSSQKLSCPPSLRTGAGVAN